MPQLDSLTAAKLHQESERALFRASEWSYMAAQNTFLDDVAKGVIAVPDDELLKSDEAWDTVTKQ